MLEALESEGAHASVLHWDPPPPGELEAHLTRACRPRGVSALGWGQFVKAVLSHFGARCGYDWREVCYAASELWPAYAAPVARAAAATGAQPPLTYEDGTILRRLAAPHFDAMRARLGYRDFQAHDRAPPPAGASAAAAADSSASSSSAAAGGGPPLPSASVTARGPLLRRDRDVLTELPHVTKLLLLAAFCGSHNPADTDARYFSRRATGRRSAQSARAAGGAGALTKRRQAYMLAGPRPFTWERLLSILTGLLAGSGTPLGPSSATAPASTAAARQQHTVSASQLAMGDVQSQLASLRALHLVTLVSGADELTAPKLRCDISLDAAGAVAGSLGLDLGKYLYDPTAS